MKSIDEIKIFIKTKAHEFAEVPAEEEWEYESIELDVFQKMVKYFANIGLTIKTPELLNTVINGTEEDDDNSDWFYMDELIDVLDEMETSGQLSSDCGEIYSFWKQYFVEGDV